MNIHTTTHKKNVVVMGGGTGTFTVLSALKHFPLHLTAIVSMSDDGGSTGELRDQYGVLPPGDARRALVALSQTSDSLRSLFSYRFESGSLKGHAIGNIFLSALENIEGNFADALSEAGRVLSIRGSVLPVTLDNVRLRARLYDGTLLHGEHSIDIPKQKERSPIKNIWLYPKASAYSKALEAIRMADAIIMGPGDLYTSLIPNFLVRGIPEAIRTSSAKKIFICNIMTKRGETDGFSGGDFEKIVEQYIGTASLDVVVYNNAQPSKKTLARYRKEGSEYVVPLSLTISNASRYVVADCLEDGVVIRHDKEKLGNILCNLI